MSTAAATSTPASATSAAMATPRQPHRSCCGRMRHAAYKACCSRRALGWLLVVILACGLVLAAELLRDGQPFQTSYNYTYQWLWVAGIVVACAPAARIAAAIIRAIVDLVSISANDPASMTSMVARVVDALSVRMTAMLWAIGCLFLWHLPVIVEDNTKRGVNAVLYFLLLVALSRGIKTAVLELFFHVLNAQRAPHVMKRAEGALYLLSVLYDQAQTEAAEAAANATPAQPQAAAADAAAAAAAAVPVFPSAEVAQDSQLVDQALVADVTAAGAGSGAGAAPAGADADVAEQPLIAGGSATPAATPANADDSSDRKLESEAAPQAAPQGDGQGSAAAAGDGSSSDPTWHLPESEVPTFDDDLIEGKLPDQGNMVEIALLSSLRHRSSISRLGSSRMGSSRTAVSRMGSSRMGINHMGSSVSRAGSTHGSTRHISGRMTSVVIEGDEAAHAARGFSGVNDDGDDGGAGDASPVLRASTSVGSTRTAAAAATPANTARRSSSSDSDGSYESAPSTAVPSGINVEVSSALQTAGAVPNVQVVDTANPSQRVVRSIVPAEPTSEPIMERMMILMEDAESVASVATVLFDHLKALRLWRKGPATVVTEASLARHLPIDDVSLLFSQLAESYHNVLTYTDFSVAIQTLYKRYMRAQVPNSAVLAVRRSLGLLIEIGVSLGLCLAFFALSGLDATTFIIPASSVFLGISFMLSSSMQRLVESLVFVLVRQPFDVGDFVWIGDARMPVRIENVGVLSTSMLTSENIRVYMPNALLATMRIDNAHRSPHAIVRFSVYTDNDVTAAQLQSLRDSLREYMTERPLVWRQPAAPMINIWDVNADDGKLMVIIACHMNGSLSRYRDYKLIRSGMINHVAQTMHSLGVSFSRGTTRVRLMDPPAGQPTASFGGPNATPQAMFAAQP